MRDALRLVPTLGTLLLLVLLSAATVATAEPLDAKLGEQAGVGGFSSDGSRVVLFVQRSLQGYPFDLLSVPVEGGEATQLNPEGSHLGDGGWGTNGERVVFSTSTEESDSELFSVPIAGGPLTKLNHPLAPGEVAQAGPITPDGTRLVYFAGVWRDRQLFVVPLTGGTPAHLDLPEIPDLPLDGIGGFFVSPDSETGVGVMFERLPPDSNENRDEVLLFSVPLAGGSPIVLARGCCRFDLQFSPDGRRVVYRQTSGPPALYSVPLAGGPIVKLTPQLAGLSDRFYVTPDSARVVYLGGGLSAVPIAGGAVTNLSPEAYPWQMSPDGERVAFARPVDYSEGVYSALVSGGPPTLLSLGPPTNSWETGRVRSIQVSSDSRFVVFADDRDVDSVWDLFSVPIAGGLVTRLGGPLEHNTYLDSEFAITADGTRVVFRADPDADGVFELYCIPIEGGLTTKLNPPLAKGAYGITISPDSRHVIYYLATIKAKYPELHSSRLPPVIQIDVLRHQAANTPRGRGRGLDAVAILGSEDVDVADVVLASLTFGPAGAAPAKRGRLRDVNSDGFTDLVTRYRRAETGIAPGDTEACLEGVQDGFEFRSCDVIGPGAD